MNDLEKAKEFLQQNSSYSVVFVRGEEHIFCEKRGVAPLLELLDAGKDLRGFAAADRVVGRGAALLHIMLGIETLYASVLSFSAEEVLKNYKVTYSFGERVDCILNRNRDGRCPIEQATEGIFDLSEGLSAIQKRLGELGKK